MDGVMDAKTFVFSFKQVIAAILSKVSLPCTPTSTI